MTGRDTRAHDAPSRPREGAGNLPPLAMLPVAAIAAGVLGLLLVFAGGYGYHRDELYFIEAGKHPAFGYDDQPPLTPLIGRASVALFGNTPTGLRVASALALAACVVLAALIARELGGRARAQVVAAACVAASAALYLGHILSTATFDFLAWTVVVLLAARVLRAPRPGRWIALGAAAGLALENKWLVGLLLGSLLVGAALARRHDLLRGPWPWLAAAIALALWAPNLIWQADHGWPQRHLSSQIAGEDPLGARLKFLPFQLLIVSPLLAPVWIAGLVWLLRDARARPFRVLGLGYLATLVVCLATGAKEYYAVGWYPALLGAGGVALQEWLVRPVRRAVLAGAVALAAVASAFISLPLVPAGSLADTPIPTLNDDVSGTVGWRRYAGQIARVWEGLPPDARRDGAIFTAGYGEAGTVARFGPALGLPRAYSGHNSYWSFGRPPDGAAPVVAVGFGSRRYLQRFFTGCRPVARLDNGARLDSDEQGAPIDVCAAPRRPWSALWPALHHLDA
jgi:hypothetical protein